jgi:hypothetical protein
MRRSSMTSSVVEKKRTKEDSQTYGRGVSTTSMQV